MAIKITKKANTTPERREPAPLVGDAAPEMATPAPVRTKEQMLAEWKAFPAPHQKPVQCAYCGQFYIKPCSDQQYSGCMNYQHFVTRKKDKA